MAEAIKHMLGQMDDRTRSRVLGGASKEARQWLHCPEDETPMPNAHYKVAARLRYNVPEPNPGGTDTCCNSLPHSGRVCGAGCRCDGGAHALVCKIEGAVQQRHDDARNVVYTWMKEMGLNPQLEQAVPSWDTPRQRAILDIAYFDTRGGPIP